MDSHRDLRLTLLALRERLIEPESLARVGADWSAADHPPFLRFLAERGVLSADHLRYLETSDADTQTFHTVSGPAGEPTASTVVGGGTPATPVDLQARGGADPPTIPGGRYRIQRLHQVGGLGQVWVAEDTTLGREVAVKTMRPDRADSPSARDHFVREARVTGRLEHPCVVPLYDLVAADDGSGSPCYAMRFVAGQTLARAAAEYHAERAAGRADALALTALLDAFVSVCRAVAFAHSRGVLHRDLKGQNVILGDFGEVFLLDWGLAGTLSGTGPDPGGGGVVGTPGYIAPEVAAGGPTSVASDVYGLGAILYAILTGRAPYHTGAAWDRVQQAVAIDPPPPRALNPSAPAALDAVCRKAMARDPAARYPSADALAVEIRRHLADEPVDAYREPWPVRAARWGRRHRTAVTAAAAILVTAVVALAVSTALVWRERDRTAEQKRRAEENFGTARALALDLSARINQLETGQSNPRLTDLARQSALDRARELFERFRDEQPDDVAVQVQTASLHRFAANVSRLLGDNPAAESAYAAAVKIWEQLADRFPEEPGHRDNLAETLRDRSMLEKRMGRLTDAAATLDRAMKLAEGLDGQLPESSCRRTQGTVELERAEIAYVRGQFDAAERSAQRALVLLDGLKGAPAEESRPYDPLLAAMAVNRVAMARREQGRVAQALEAHDDAVKRLGVLAGPKANRDERFWDHQVRRERARTAAAVADRREAAAGDLERLLPAAAKLVEEYPNVPHYRQALAAAYLRRGEVLTLLGRPEPAAAELTKSLAVSRELLDRHGLLSDSLLVRGETFLALARALAAAGMKGEAAARWKDAARLFAVALKRDPDNHHHRRGSQEAERAGRPTAP